MKLHAVLLKLFSDLMAAHGGHAVAELDATTPLGFHLAFTDHFGPLGAASCAWGEFRDDINSTGWSWLELQTSAQCTDMQQAKAAGLIEGALTQTRIDEYLHNTFATTLDFGQDLQDFISNNTRWVESRVHMHRGEPFWDHVALAYEQVRGLHAGYNSVREQHGMPQVNWTTFYALSLYGDLDDLCNIFSCEGTLQQRVQNTSNSHCSVLIKIVEAELYMGHSTWTQFEQMTRIFKLYRFAYSSTPPGQAVSFSSYPGTVVSFDDFYQTSAGLVVMESSLTNENPELWKLVVPQSLLYWVRVLVANLLADSGPAWAATFSKYNSGTYNNQWMILDTKGWHYSEEQARMKPHTLTVSELLSGFVHTEDMTIFLDEHGYWASYNRPFFQDTFNLSGQPAMVARYGDHFSWSRTARAQIFRRLMPSIVDQRSFQRAMRYNNYLEDPVGMQGCKVSPSASNAIAERGDLTSKSADCISDISLQDEAQIDVKYTTASLMREGCFGAVAQSGPTYDNQPPFRWSSSPFASHPHLGQPDFWRFPWVNVTWRTLCPDRSGILWTWTLIVCGVLLSCGILAWLLRRCQWPWGGKREDAEAKPILAEGEQPILA